MDQEKVGKFIAKLRKEKKYTQVQLGLLIHADHKMISKWECGTYAPDIKFLRPLSEALGITINELLAGEKNPALEKENTTEKDDFIVNNLITYTKQEKKRFLPPLLIIVFSLLLILFVLGGFYLVLEYHQWRRVDFDKTNDTYVIQGSVLYNQSETNYYIDSVLYNANYIGTTKEPIVKEISAQLYLEEQLLGEKEFVFNEFVTFHKALQNIYFYDVSSSIKFHKEKEIKLLIQYKDQYDEEKLDIIYFNQYSKH